MKITIILLTIFYIYPAIAKKKSYQKNIIDIAHHSIAQTWNNANNGLDSFFANTDFVEEESDGYLKLTLFHRINEHGAVVTNFDFRMKTSFPQTTKKLKFVIKDDSEQQQINKTTTLHSLDNSPTQLKSASTASRYSAVLQYNFFEKSSWKITTDQGMRLDLPLNPFIQLRIRHNSKVKLFHHSFEINLIQHLRYYYQEKLSENSEFQLHKKLSATFNFSFSTGIGWNHQTQEFILGHALNLHQNWSDKTVINYSGSMGTSLKAIRYKTFSCGVSITQQLYRNWFY